MGGVGRVQGANWRHPRGPGRMKRTARLLAKILSQDIEENKNKKTKIRQGVAKD